MDFEDIDFFGSAAVHIENRFREHGIRTKGVLLATDTPWPDLPKNFAVRVWLELPDGQKWWSFCSWSNLENYCALISSIEQWQEMALEDLKKRKEIL